MRPMLSAAMLTVLVLAGAAGAKVPASDAARLGKDLTPLGAIRAGNAVLVAFLCRAPLARLRRASVGQAEGAP